MKVEQVQSKVFTGNKNSFGNTELSIMEKRMDRSNIKMPDAIKDKIN